MRMPSRWPRVLTLAALVVLATWSPLRADDRQPVTEAERRAITRVLIGKIAQLEVQRAMTAAAYTQNSIEIRRADAQLRALRVRLREITPARRARSRRPAR
jgi:hypothetical protein